MAKEWFEKNSCWVLNVAGCGFTHLSIELENTSENPHGRYFSSKCSNHFPAYIDRTLTRLKINESKFVKPEIRDIEWTKRKK